MVKCYKTKNLDSYYLEMSILDNYYWEWKSIREKITELEEENRRLSEKNKIYSNALVQEKENNKSLKEENRFLEQCLDNKEKVNKSLREENKRLSDFLECEA